jgi:hypothetical protein
MQAGFKDSRGVKKMSEPQIVIRNNLSTVVILALVAVIITQMILSYLTTRIYVEQMGFIGSLGQVGISMQAPKSLQSKTKREVE